MSWDIFVQDLPADARDVADIPNDFRSVPLGTRAELIRKICEVVPTANFTDPSWGVINGPGYSVEVNMGNNEILTGFAFHVRGGAEAVDVIADILDHLQLRAIASGRFFDRTTALADFDTWKQYRDHVVSSTDTLSS